ncbi:hypothetical protein D3C73_882530 [compost metagenome]
MHYSSVRCVYYDTKCIRNTMSRSKEMDSQLIKSVPIMLLEHMKLDFPKHSILFQLSPN